MKKAWDHFWFEPDEAAALGAARIVFFLITFWVYCTKDFSGWNSDLSLFWQPTSFFRLLPGPPSAEFLVNWQWAWKFSLIICALGLAGRLATSFCALSGYFLLGLRECFGNISHGTNITVLCLFVFAICRCTDALSFDSLLAKKAFSKSGNYRWPIRLLTVIWCFPFFSAGMAKSIHSGFHWFYSDGLIYHMLGNRLVHSEYADVFKNIPDLGPWIASSPVLASLIAFLALALELSTPLALFFVRLRIPIVLLIGIMQSINFYLLQVPFASYAATFAMWIPWYSLRKYLKS